ncbi:uncharacterized protein [Periplaneta americana]|uniref:uncharacterized protein isoform X2 n=1 Tax=Periplaneta americana TaxID=6978 RepID=UPI0037E878EC
MGRRGYVRRFTTPYNPGDILLQKGDDKLILPQAVLKFMATAALKKRKNMKQMLSSGQLMATAEMITVLNAKECSWELLVSYAHMDLSKQKTDIMAVHQTA